MPIMMPLTTMNKYDPYDMTRLVAALLLVDSSYVDLHCVLYKIHDCPQCTFIFFKFFLNKKTYPVDYEPTETGNIRSYLQCLLLL